MWISFGPSQLKALKTLLSKHEKGGKPILSRIIQMEEDEGTEEAEKYRQAARERSRDGELEVDEGAIVSKGDDPGAYVMAWLWITGEEAGFEEEEIEEEPGPREWSPRDKK